MTDFSAFAGGQLLPAATQAVANGDHDRAIALFEAEIGRGVADPATLSNYGVLLWRVFEFDRAEELFARVLAHADSTPEMMRQLAKCYFEIGRFDAAARVMRAAAARMNPSDAPTLNTLAWTLERDNQIAAARDLAGAALAIDPTYGPAVRLLAHIERRSGEFDAAVARLHQHLARHPGQFDWGLRYELAAILDRLGEYDDAWNELCQAKSQLGPVASQHMKHSQTIRNRQWQLVRQVTDADLRRWRKAADELPPAKRICFLTGFPRSGTTLLEQILAANPDAVDTDETGIFANQFIAPIVWKANDALDAIIELRSFSVEQLQAGREAFYRMTERYLGEEVKGRLLIEKNPLMTCDLALPLRLFPEASVLVALRDPRDVVLSYLFTMVPLNWSSAPAIDVVEACRFYADTMRHWLWWRTRLDWPAYETHYERLIAEPEAELQRVAEFLDLTWDPAMLDERHRSERKAVRTPTYIDVTKPLYSRAIGRWRNYQEFMEPGLEILKPFVQAFGYET